MKKLIYIFALVAFVFTSCDKNAENNDSQSQIELIRQKSKTLSENHDSIVNEMLTLQKSKTLQKAKGTNESNVTLNSDEIFDVIEQVTGVRPIVIKTATSNIQRVGSIETRDSLSYIDLDAENLSLTNYGNSAISKKYLKLVDEVIQTENTSISEKTEAINKIQELIVKDNLASLTDIEEVLNGTEVLKGSLKFWSEEYSADSQLKVLRMYKAKSGPVTWSFWQKIAFISAADAIGAVGGFFLGGVITVGGVSAYVPPGATGLAASAAGISYIATAMCGWVN